MAESAVDADDIAELETVLAAAKQPLVVGRLLQLLGEWRNEFAQRSAAAAPAAPPAAAQPPPPAPRRPSPPLAPSVTRPGATAAFVPIESFGWDQDAYPSKYVSVYLTSGLDGVGDLPRENVVCKFERDAFDLQVHGLAGRNFRLVKTALEHDIDPSESKCIVKKNRVTLKLRKVEREFGADHWGALTKKRPGAAAAGGAAGGGDKDPAAGIMDLMRDLYEEGDDNMRKTIGEAMLKSRQERAAGADDF